MRESMYLFTLRQVRDELITRATSLDRFSAMLVTVVNSVSAIVRSMPPIRLVVSILASAAILSGCIVNPPRVTVGSIYSVEVKTDGLSLVEAPRALQTETIFGATGSWNEAGRAKRLKSLAIVMRVFFSPATRLWSSQHPQTRLN
jgi:hypothetical protein